MASIQKTATGWRAQVDVKGQRASAVRLTKREVTEWAREKEQEFRAHSEGDMGHGKSLRDLMRRYAEEESPRRRGERWEIVRLSAFEKPDHGLPVARMITRITDDDVRRWREKRLKIVSRGTVIRDMTLLQSVFEHARIEWKWLKHNPFKDVKKPTSPAHRKRIITGVEIKAMLRSLGWTRGPVRSVSQAVAAGFLLALSTGMRAGEVCGLLWGDVRADYVTARNVKAKALGVNRDVPLSKYANKVIARLRGWDDKLVVGIGSGSLDALFRKARKRAGLDGFTFHDSRHTAATRLAMSGKWHVLDLCKAFGWADPKQAMSYFNPTAEQLAHKLR